MPCLRIKLPDGKGEITHVLAGDRITIGRRPDNTIQIIDRTVSAHHAELIASNGHYRLHDLGSTNLTCVNGQAITDFHLHDACPVTFGTVECEFSPETPVSTNEKPVELVPTRAELEYLRRENLDLQAKIVAQQKQIDILSSARLLTKDTQALGVSPEAYRKIIAERDDMKALNDNFRVEVESLKNEITGLEREREAMRQAYDTLKAELEAAHSKLKEAGMPLPPSEPPPPKVNTDTEKIVKVGLPGPLADTQRITGPLMSPDAHRAMATVLMQAPGVLKALRSACERLTANPADAEAAGEIEKQSEALATCMNPVSGHPVQRLASAISSFLHEQRSKNATLDKNSARNIASVADLCGTLLQPQHLKRVRELDHPRALVIDDDPQVLNSLKRTLGDAAINVTGSTDVKSALDLLHTKHFDLILLDLGLPDGNGIELCSKIREIPGTKKTPIVIITGADNIDNRAQTSLNGANDFVGKPFDSRELTIKVESWIYRSQFGLLETASN